MYSMTNRVNCPEGADLQLKNEPCKSNISTVWSDTVTL